MESQTKIATLYGHDDYVYSVSFNSSGQSLQVDYMIEQSNSEIWNLKLKQ